MRLFLSAYYKFIMADNLKTSKLGLVISPMP